jgi:hypothetical protein
MGFVPRRRHWNRSQCAVVTPNLVPLTRHNLNKRR